MSTQENQEVTLVSSKKERKRKAQYCDLEGNGDVACDYEQHGASIISEKVTIPSASQHLELVGKALCQRHYNKLIVNVKKKKLTYVHIQNTNTIFLQLYTVWKRRLSKRLRND